MQVLDTIEQGQFVVRRLTGSIGASITGVDVRRLDTATYSPLRAALLEHGMLVLPGQSLSAEELSAFGKLWGEPWNTPNFPPLKGSEYLYAVQNLGKEQVVTENWHYDSTYAVCPPAISLLSAHVLPPAGGDTMWANQYLAYDSLSQGMRKVCDELKAVHRDIGLYKHNGLDEDPQEPAVHPVVRTHPETGRKALFLSIGVERFEGMTVQESMPLFNFLYAHAVQPHFIYRHQWTLGDLVIWDNRCTMHYAVHDYGSAKRKLYRVTVAGEQPA